jgi:hypothetical protein
LNADRERGGRGEAERAAGQLLKLQEVAVTAGALAPEVLDVGSGSRWATAGRRCATKLESRPHARREEAAAAAQVRSKPAGGVGGDRVSRTSSPEVRGHKEEVRR